MMSLLGHVHELSLNGAS